ncbi:MAG: Gfo/Idh/MocA family oxidoreductase [Solirubrobacterales bacterium]|nr:Gfo/Idh/MocA family oxidoreductase [Solirubrobacterales bacterium]
MDENPPRLGFVGVGWIGRHRMEAVQRAGAARVAAIADPDARAAQAAAAAVGCDQVHTELDALISDGLDLDGIVIATPTALHARQTRQALERRIPVFCQKPLGRTAGECRELIALAREADALLGVDMSYRYAAAVTAALDALHTGAIGRPHAAELVFHNAYGPDKAWVRDAELAGGGALIDLGCHLVDLARLFLGDLAPAAVHADLFAGGERLGADPERVEDLALAQVTLEDGRVIRLACSWWLPAGADAVLEASFFGQGRALTIRNVDGSFYDFEALLVEGRGSERIAEPPDEWGGRALIAWTQQLRRDRSFDEDVEQLVQVADLIDQIYGRST